MRAILIPFAGRQSVCCTKHCRQTNGRNQSTFFFVDFSFVCIKREANGVSEDRNAENICQTGDITYLSRARSSFNETVTYNVEHLKGIQVDQAINRVTTFILLLSERPEVNSDAMSNTH